MKKKLLSILVLTALLLQLVIGSAMAQNGVSGRLTVEKKTVPMGTSEVAVQVTLEENPGISNVRFIFAYPEGFTLKRIQKGDALSTLHFTPPGNLTANPVTPIWDGTEADTSNGVVVTLTFDISDQVKPGDYAVTVSYKKSDLLDGDLNDIDIELVQGGVTIVCPHTDKTEHAAVAADCTNAGNALYYTCNTCGKLLDKDGAVIEAVPVLNALGHNLTHHDAKAPTCVADGNVEYWLCSRCNKAFADENGTQALEKTGLDAKGHDYVHHDKVAASHAAAGMEEHYTCNNCDTYFDAQKNVTTREALVLDKIPHSFGDWIKTETNHKRICECGEEADAGTHTFQWIIDRAATEDATGLKHEECTVCHYAKAGVEIPKLDHTHNMNHNAAVAPTCTTDGTVEYWHCTKCGKNYADANGATELTSVKAEALGHSMTHHAAVPATCVQDGTKEYWACALCNKNFADANGAQELTSIVDKSTGHAYGEYVVTKPATCTDKGQETSTCAKCNDKIYRDINALGHDYGAYVETKAATCTEQGEETATCSRCQDKQVRKTDALGHQPGEFTVTKAATCTDKGEKVAICGVCQEEVKVEIPALGHKWDNGVVTKAATATEKGEKTFTCETCHLTRTEEIAALGGSDAGVPTGDNAPIAVFTLLAVLSVGGVLVLNKKKAERK